MVDIRPWPAVGAISLLTIMLGIVQWFHSSNIELLSIALAIIILLVIQWWRDVSREASLQGLHTTVVTDGLRMGIILFIVSEVMFFFSFF